MRIAMPIAEGKFSLHYGSCEVLSIHDIDLQSGVATPVAVVDAPAEGMCGAGPWIASQGVQVLLAGGLGAGAAQGLGKAGVRVFAGIKETDPAKVLEMFLDGVAEARELAPGESMCHGHEDGHEHRHGADHVCTCGSH
jgi:predicted Fe-Mo cluster-binding NifX family protein